MKSVLRHTLRWAGLLVLFAGVWSGSVCHAQTAIESADDNAVTEDDAQNDSGQGLESTITFDESVTEFTAEDITLYTLYSSSSVKNVRAADVPNDDSGKGLDVVWEYEGEPSESLVGFHILRRADAPGSSLEKITAEPLPPTARDYRDASAAPARKDPLFTREKAVPYIYAVQEVYEASAVNSAESAPAAARSNWFHTGRSWLLAAALLFCGTLVVLTYRSREGDPPRIRRIDGLEAVEEAIGRSAEMDKPILYIAGIGSVQQMATIASINIFSHVIKTAAEHATRIMVPCYDPIVMQVMRTVGEQTYQSIGRPDLYDPDNIFFVTESQFAYAAGVDGIIVREEPAAIFLQGVFYAESLILAETGHSVGAIQIAGTDRDAQLPFFIAACDYTLIGEELFAASAYLSQDAPLLSAIRAQDVAKAVLMILMIVGVVMALFGSPDLADIFKVEM